MNIIEFIAEGLASVTWAEVHLFWKVQVYLMAGIAALVPFGFLHDYLRDHLTTRRVGGLLFWRIGRLGGSLYIARTRREVA